jgi:protein-disulfide isomerase
MKKIFYILRSLSIGGLSIMIFILLGCTATRVETQTEEEVISPENPIADETEGLESNPSTHIENTEPKSPTLPSLFTQDDPTLGSLNATIQLVVFSDKQCPYCALFAPVIDEIKSDWIDTGKVVVQYRDFPLKGHQHSAKAALAAWAAQNQGKYWEYHTLLYAGQADWSSLEDKPFMDILITYAEQLDLDLAKFRSDLQSQTGRDEAQQDLQDALAHGVTGTPTFFINGRIVKGNRNKETLEEWFNELLK